MPWCEEHQDFCRHAPLPVTMPPQPRPLPRSFELEANPMEWCKSCMDERFRQDAELGEFACSDCPMCLCGEHMSKHDCNVGEFIRTPEGLWAIECWTAWIKDEMENESKGVGRVGGILVALLWAAPFWGLVIWAAVYWL